MHYKGSSEFKDFLKKFRDCSESDEHEGLRKGKASFGLVFAKTLGANVFTLMEICIRISEV